ncbi:zinc-binding dehydrogenase [bacterium SCSIO 12643]|nr:zinc-binding dehydrogenase [bacterium SCSIO 12643]
MKAAFLVQNGAAPSVFQVRETETPQFKENEVLIKVETFGLNYADVMARKGLYAAAPPLPSILGYEAVGHISKVGNNVTQFKVGDRVLAFTRFGAYAEYCVAPIEAVVLLPSEIPNDAATALATQYCTAIYAAKRMANIQKSERVLIHAAAGGVGHALIQLAQHKGCEIIATVGNDEKKEHLQNMGLSHIINYTEYSFNESIKSTFGEKSVDVIFDPIGGKNHKLNRDLLAIGGRMIMYGISSFSNKKGTWYDKLQLMLQFGFLSPLHFLIHSNGIIGVNMLHVASEKPSILTELLEDAVQGYLDGIYKPHMAFHGKISDLPHAHELLEKRSTIGKLAVSWS